MGDQLNPLRDTYERFLAIQACEFSKLLGMRTLSVSQEEVKVEMDLEGKRNSILTGHGGAIFSLADQAFAIACNLGEQPQVARSASIKFIKPANGKLVATARRVKEDEKGAVYRVDITEGETLVAIFEGIGHKIREH